MRRERPPVRLRTARRPVGAVRDADADEHELGRPLDRLRFREMDKEWVVNSSHKYTIAGLVLLGIGITAVILLVSHVVFSEATAIIATALIAASVLWVWFGAALVRARQDRSA